MADDQEEFLLEEVNEMEVPEEEKAQFQITEPLEVLSVISDVNSKLKKEKIEENEASLIKRFVSGEVDFPDLYTKFETEEKLDLLSDDENEMDTIPVPSNEASYASLCPNSPLSIDATETKQRSRAVRKRPALSGALQGLMGEANLSFARGQVEKAEKICLEIIRLNPLASEPFYTLAEIYESRDPEKYLNFLVIAAHLNPSDLEHTLRVAETFKANNDMARARFYYSRAIKYYPKDYELRLQKAILLESIGDKTAAMLAYLRMLPLLPPEQKELCMATAKKVADYFHSVNKKQLALEAMESAFTICSSSFTVELFNLYLQVLIMNKLYWKVVMTLNEHTKLMIVTQNVHGAEFIKCCVIPNDYVPEVRIKFTIALIHLGATHLFEYLIKNIHEHIPTISDNMELYAEIIESLMQGNHFEDVITLISPIISGDRKQCPPFIWLKHADCLRCLNRINEAIESYNLVLELAPLCYEAKFTLSALLKQQGRPIEAVKALEQANEADGHPLNARLLYERCIMLKQIEEIDEFLEAGRLLLGRHSLKLENREEMMSIANGTHLYNTESLKVILQMRNINEDSDKAWQEFNKAQVKDSDLTVEDEYNLFLDLITTAFEHRKFSIIEKLCFAMITTKRFASYHVDLERITILACYFNGDSTIAFSYLRELIVRNSNNKALWNLLSLLVKRGQDLRYHRYVRRFVQRSPVLPEVHLFLAHYHLYCCSYKYALNIYAPIFQTKPNSLVGLCIAVAFNQIAMQKKVQRKAAAVGQAICFAKKYGELRESELKAITEENTSCPAEEEICFNIGRIYHQSGLLHLAIEYYERGLMADNPLIAAHEHHLGLKQEIAYNLHLIYKASGNLSKARDLLYKYCVV